MSPPRFVAVADHAVLVEFGTSVTNDIHEAVLQLDRAIAANPPDGAREVIPAMVNLLVEFDPLVTDHTSLEAAITALLSISESQHRKPQQHDVAVCYDADLAPDLQAVAQACGISIDAAINAHLAANYEVFMYGFAPGYAYLDGVPQTIRQPRKPAPLHDIPAGSVLIAGAQCLVSTLKMPTGWSIIGRSPTAILRDDPKKPFLFDVGDTVRFTRINRATLETTQ